MYESIYTGHGELCLAPPLLGDLAAIRLDGSQQWYLGKNAYLASTIDISKKTKSQGIGKALFSGEDLFVYQLTGNGVIWVTSFGAITRRDVSYCAGVCRQRLIVFRFLLDKPILLTMAIW